MEFFKSVWRFISLQSLRQSWKVNKAGDRVFTKDATGRAAAYDLEMDTLRRELNEFLDALAQAETAVALKRGEVTKKQKALDDTRAKLKGAVIVFTQAQAANDAARMARAQADGAGFQSQITKMEADIAALEKQIEVQQAGFAQLEEQFKQMKARLDALPAEKAESIANYMSNSSFIKAQERISGLLQRQHQSPLDTVRQADDELAAKAVVVGRVLGQTASKDDDYLKAAQTDAAGADFMALVAAHKAEKDSAAGVAPETGERPKI